MLARARGAIFRQRDQIAMNTDHLLKIFYVVIPKFWQMVLQPAVEKQNKWPSQALF